MLKTRTLAWTTVLLLATLRVVGPPPAHAQSAPELQGTVVDVTDGVIVGALVELRGPSITRQARTDARGEFRFSNLLPGEYDLLVTYHGFRPVHERHLVERGARVATRVVLSVLMTADVSVSSTAADGERGLSSLATQVLSREDLADLPVGPSQLLRRLWELAGATGRPEDLVVYVDGFRQVQRLPPTDAIQMIRISANPLAAEYDEPGRVRIEIVTRPGSDRYQGELRFTFNDGALNARPVSSADPAPVRTENYTGYFSGPLVPNRWSLTLYGGRWRQNESEGIRATVLNAETLTSEPFAAEVVTPTTVDSGWIGTDYQAGRHTLALSFEHTREEARHQGLDEGVDLPERAYTESDREAIGRLALTSSLGQRLFNELRVQLSRRNVQTDALTSAPAVVVLDAFSAGGNQDHLFRRGTINRVQLSEHLTYAMGATTFKVGAAGDVKRQSDTDRSGFGGTFIFGSDVERDGAGLPVEDPAGAEQGPALIDPLEVYRRTLLGVPGYGPSQFWIVQGDPGVQLWQWWGGWFVQADWVPSDRFTMSYGIRHELQTHVKDRNNVSPRLGVAWAPGAEGANMVRAGAGIFYHRMPSEVLLDARRNDGLRQQRLVVSQPSFFPDVPDGELLDATVRTPTIRVLDEALRTPQSVIGTLSDERRLRANLFADVSYRYERGRHLLRTRDVNAPVGRVRPDPERGAVLQYESSASAEDHEVAVALRTNWTRRVTVFGNYTWSASRSDADRPSAAPADSYALANEVGPISTHRHHLARMGVRLRLPAGFSVNATALIQSGRPFNITTGRDNNGDTLFTDRPAFADPSDPDAIGTAFGTFDPHPAAGDAIIPRNLGREPAEVRVDLHVSRAFPVGLGRTRARFGADFVNLFNRANAYSLNGVLTSPDFGRARRTREPRRVDLTMGVSF